MDIIQTFYDHMAPQYDTLFLDWKATTHEQAVILDSIFRSNGLDPSASVLDCACGIGTQAIGLARLGYPVTASDFSEGALVQAKERTGDNGVQIRFERADFCALSEVFSEVFDIVIAMDNALPHMLTAADLDAVQGFGISLYIAAAVVVIEGVDRGEGLAGLLHVPGEHSLPGLIERQSD
jgi:SAM-dependent methyltransferase